MVVYNYNPSTWKTEARGLNIRGQPGLHRGYTARPCLKKRRRKEMSHGEVPAKRRVQAQVRAILEHSSNIKVSYVAGAGE
jgi:hypothetical protein